MVDPRKDEVIPEDPPLPAEDIELPVRGFAINRAKAIVAAAGLWTGFAVMVYLVTNDLVRGFDQHGLLLYRQGEAHEPIGPAWLHEAVRDVTALGGVTISTLATAGAVVALLFLKMRREAVLLALTVIGGWMLNNSMKILFGRERPEIVPHLTEAGGLSFPSGHSFASAMIYIAMAIAFASLSNRHLVRYTIIGSAMLVSGAIAWSRVMLGVHFPSDVVAGWLAGAGWAFAAAALLYGSAKAAADSEAADHLDPTSDLRRAQRARRR